jgi:hypothetical protein
MRTLRRATPAIAGTRSFHQTSFAAHDNPWTRLEVHIKLNTDIASSAGPLLEVWKKGALVQPFDSASSMGGGIKEVMGRGDDRL